MASTAGPKPRRGSRSRRQVRVKVFTGRCATSSEGKLLRRLVALGFERVAAGQRSSSARGRFAHSADPNVFLGKLGESRVHIHLQKGALLELRATFSPRVSFRHASKLLSRLGLRGLKGIWT